MKKLEKESKARDQKATSCHTISSTVENWAVYINKGNKGKSGRNCV